MSLRIADNNDLYLLHELYMAPANNPYLMYEQIDYPAFVEAIGALVAAGHIYLYELDGAVIGTCKLIPNKYRCEHIVYLGGFAIHPDQHGKGHGEGMLRAIIAQLQANPDYHRLELSTYVSNERAIRLYEKCGFEKEGVLRNYTYLKSEHKFVDEVMMSLLW